MLITTQRIPVNAKQMQSPIKDFTALQAQVREGTLRLVPITSSEQTIHTK